MDQQRLVQLFAGQQRIQEIRELLEDTVVWNGRDFRDLLEERGVWKSWMRLFGQLALGEEDGSVDQRERMAFFMAGKATGTKVTVSAEETLVSHTDDRVDRTSIALDTRMFGLFDTSWCLSFSGLDLDLFLGVERRKRLGGFLGGDGRKR